MATSTSVRCRDQPGGNRWPARVRVRPATSIRAAGNAWRSSGSSCARRSASSAGTGTGSATLEPRTSLEVGTGGQVDVVRPGHRDPGAVVEDLDQALLRVDAGLEHDLRTGDGGLVVLVGGA